METSPTSTQAQRGKAFTMEEDKILCSAWLEVSQDPVKGINQKKDRLWERIIVIFHARRPSHYLERRTPKSLQCRMSNISKAINKFRGCVRSIERLNPSGASEVDIIEKAKELFAQDSTEKKGFQLDHVWPILREAEKWLDNDPKEIAKRSGYDCSEYPGCPTSVSPETPTFVDLNADEDCEDTTDYHVDSFGRPTGRKKEKVRRKQAVDTNRFLQSIADANQDIVENLKKGQMQREERYARMEKDATMHCQVMMLQAENERARIQLERERQEKEFMEKDLNSIEDPTDREYFRRKKMEIVENRAQTSNNSSDFNHGDFNNFSHYQNGGLPEY